MTLISRISNLLGKVFPRPIFLLFYGIHACYKVTQALIWKYGFGRSALRWSSINRAGEPIPWFSYPSIEYLDQLDLRERRIFEYGSGNSTRYWARKAREVIAAEDDQAWKEKTEKALPSNARILFANAREAYAGAIALAGAQFDIIIVDGSHRLDCAKAALPFLKPGGFFILDDSDDYTGVAQLFRQNGLIEIDFAGFNPINSYSKTTSLFLHPDFKPLYLGTQAPFHSLGHHAVQ